ncbi:MAG TPA: right-handed parallel beta-helix repeat-containing protein, partial [Gaiellaceae bacterium]|nr:right-handed parallel beta-helix repeat-containing protein [Gaiellaceae bacterium]
ARWASPTGDDAAAGSAAAPYRTVTRLAASLRPGENGCLTAGATFAENVQIWNAGVAGRPIKILTAGTPRATILGSISLSWRAHDVVLAALRVEGAGFAAPVTVHGARTTLVRVEVAGGAYASSGSACVRIEKAAGVLLDGDEIHDCTGGAAAPGVLVLDARNARISNSFVYHVAGAGIALGRGATAARVEHNIVDGNIGGVAIDGRGNEVIDNIISNSSTWNVHGSTSAAANVVSRNCLWGGGSGQIQGPGFVASHNVVADPRYRDRAHGLSLDTGPCFSKRPRSFELATTDLGTPWPRLPGIAVRWSVREHAGRVYVESLAFAHIAPGSSAVVRCVRGCTLSERLPSSSALAESAQLDGHWLPNGAVLELREGRLGWVGAYARITVDGGKQGLAVVHACLGPLGGQDAVACSRYGGAP